MVSSLPSAPSTRVLSTKRDIARFVAFPDTLYAGDPFYTPYIRSSQRATLRQLVLADKTYTARVVERDGKILAQALSTVAPHHRMGGKPCGFFCMFDSIDDPSVAKMLFDGVTDDVRARGADMLEGPYFPYDQDNRRGVLCEGYEYPPVILTSYNKPYYNDLLLACGFEKHFDTLAFRIRIENAPIALLTRIADRAEREYDYRIDTADFSKTDREIADLRTIMLDATHDLIYQEPPTEAQLRQVFVEWHAFLRPEYILFARRNSDNAPLGAVIAVPDFFRVFRAGKGRTDPIALLRMQRARGKIDIVRGLMQYVLPEWQNRGVTASLYRKLFSAMRDKRLAYLEASTIMEENLASRAAIERVGGQPYRRFRIYGKHL